MCLKKFIFSKFAGLEAYSGQLYYQINPSTGIFQRLFKLFKLTSRNCYNNNDYKMHMFKKSKLATTSTFKQVGESNRKFPDQTYSSIFFFHLMTQCLFHPDIHGGSLSSTVLLIQLKYIFIEQLIRLKNMYVFIVLFAKHSS